MKKLGILTTAVTILCLGAGVSARAGETAAGDSARTTATHPASAQAPTPAAPAHGSATAPAPGSPSASSLDGARGTLDKWVETQQIIAREKKDWQQGRELLTSRIQLVKDEIAQLRQKLDETHKSEQEFLKSRSESFGERDAVKSISTELGTEAGALEAKVRTLYKAMPVSMREKVQPLYDRMPPDPATAKVTVAERYQNVLGILNEMNRLNGEITVASEIRSLSDGKPSEVKTLYLGLGQAWYLSARGEAGVGRPGPDGWTWQPAPEVADDLTHAFEILQNKSSPKFIPLPVTIQ